MLKKIRQIVQNGEAKKLDYKRTMMHLINNKKEMQIYRTVWVERRITVDQLLSLDRSLAMNIETQMAKKRRPLDKIIELGLVKEHTGGITIYPELNTISITAKGLEIQRLMNQVNLW